MNSESTLNLETRWQQQNYDSLLAEIDLVKKSLRSKLPDRGQQNNAASDKPTPVLHLDSNPGLHSTKQIARPYSNIGVSEAVENVEWLEGINQTSVILNNFCDLFGLSVFDRQLLMLCVGVELDAEIPTLCMELVQQPYPTMALALMCFDGHCSALAPEAPLTHFQLIVVKHDNRSFMGRSLATSDWVLFYLTGTPILDPLLSTCMHPIKLNEPKLPTQLKSAQHLCQSRQFTSGEPTVVQLISTAEGDQRQVAALLAKQEEREVYEFSLYQLPLRADEQKGVLCLIEREVISRQCLLLIDCQRLISGGESKTDVYVLRNWLDCLIRDLPNAFLLYATEQVELSHTKIHYQHLPALCTDEQLQLWQHCLQGDNGDELKPTLLELAAQYNLTERQVRSIARSASIEADGDNLQEKLWQHSREQSRQNLHGLARVISPGNLGWDDLILTEKEKNSLQSIVAQTKQRQQVYHQWGFAKQVSYGLGICALFAGGSGTGKTMAARIIASLLNLDLYHVDLSSVVDKYIGETEKKLDKLFQAAENSGAVLLFDEADALFGRRTKVQDSRDRYANMGVSFLLQRMERYSGLSILTTNLRSAMDAAFSRRLRFIIQFPFPSAQEREKIWKCMMPDNAPRQNIDYQKLSRLILSGGAIRNIILQAAFMAAEFEQSINMQCICEAVRQEYIKSEKTLDENLIKDW